MTTQSEKEVLQRNKRRQAKYSYVASGAGLTTAALLGGSAIVRKPQAFKPKAIVASAKQVKNLRLRKPNLSTPETREVFANKMKDKAYLVGAGGGAIGGIGSLNFARMQRKEADTLVKKDDRGKHAAASGAALLGAGGALGYHEYTNERRVTPFADIENYREKGRIRRAEKYKKDRAYAPFSQQLADVTGKRKRARSPVMRNKWANEREALVTSPEFQAAQTKAKMKVNRRFARNRKVALVGGIGLAGTGVYQGAQALRNH